MIDSYTPTDDKWSTCVLGSTQQWVCWSWCCPRAVQANLKDADTSICLGVFFYRIASEFISI